MAAKVIDARNSTLVGTIAQIKAFLDAVAPSRGASVVNLQGSTFVVASEGQVDKIIEKSVKGKVK